MTIDDVRRKIREQAISEADQDPSRPLSADLIAWERAAAALEAEFLTWLHLDGAWQRFLEERKLAR